MKSTVLPDYNIEVKQWIFEINHKNLKITLEAPAPDPRQSPDLVTNWKYLHPTHKILVPSADFQIEKFNEKEYQEMFPESKQLTKTGMYLYC